METQNIDRGLWQWRLPHPEWTPEKDKPGGWGQMVASVYAEPPAPGNPPPRQALLLIDPLVPAPGSPEATRFWSALDADVHRLGAPVRILIGNEYHSRSAQEVFDRYIDKPGASLWCQEAARPHLKCRVTDTFGPPGVPSGGVIPFPVKSLSDGEVVLLLPGHRALVVADALLGAGEGRVRVAPPSWAPQTEQGRKLYEREFRASLARLLEEPFERILVSHGPSVLENGRAALAEALEAPAWGA